MGKHLFVNQHPQLDSQIQGFGQENLTCGQGLWTAAELN